MVNTNSVNVVEQGSQGFACSTVPARPERGSRAWRCRRAQRRDSHVPPGLAPAMPAGRAEQTTSRARISPQVGRRRPADTSQAPAPPAAAGGEPAAGQRLTPLGEGPGAKMAEPPCPRSAAAAVPGRQAHDPPRRAAQRSPALPAARDPGPAGARGAGGRSRRGARRITPGGGPRPRRGRPLRLRVVADAICTRVCDSVTNLVPGPAPRYVTLD